MAKRQIGNRGLTFQRETEDVAAVNIMREQVSAQSIDIRVPTLQGHAFVGIMDVCSVKLRAYFYLRQSENEMKV